MSSLHNIRLIVDEPQAGDWNMAVDEALMKSVGGELTGQSGGPVLRFYRWHEPTLSLGYFQSHRQRNQHPPSQSLTMVRRNSGGGAIIHDQELTYSFTMPETAISDSGPIRKSTDLYSLLHDTLIHTLSSFGIDASKVAELDAELEANFLCFSRRAPNDVVLEGQKVCGSAQRKKFKAISQHGSVILRTSSFAPEITGISNISGRDVQLSLLIDRWSKALITHLDATLEPSILSQTEKNEAQTIKSGKFATLKWNLRR